MPLPRALAAAALIALGACTSTDTAWHNEAGAEVETASFGNATMNNVLIHSGDRQFTLDLANRFAAETTSTVNFAFNSAALDGAAREILLRQAQWIAQFPEVRFRVFGHTDAVGSNAYNNRLGMRRAQAVVGFLTAQGISRSRLEAVVSRGETQPLIVTSGREARNRRTVTEVTGFVAAHPSVLDGKYAQIVYREYVESAAALSTLSGTTGGSDTAAE
ncbi:MAG: OmpA family protein [Rhodobacteraceae bacterium]|nr:OmpA family protein [Paracoccaceae bacterium]